VGVALHEVKEVYLEDMKGLPIFKGDPKAKLSIEKLVSDFNRHKAHPALRPETIRLAITLIMEMVPVGEACLVFVGGMMDIDEVYDQIQQALRGADLPLTSPLG